MARMLDPTDEELVARERAVGHLVERDGVGQLARAVELQPIGEQEQADLRSGDGVVAVGDGVHDRFVDDVEVVPRVAAASARSGVRRRLHELRDEGDPRVDLVGHRPGKPLGVNEVVGRQPLVAITGGFDGGGGQEVGGFGAEGQRRSVISALPADRMQNATAKAQRE